MVIILQEKLLVQERSRATHMIDKEARLKLLQRWRVRVT